MTLEEPRKKRSPKIKIRWIRFARDPSANFGEALGRPLAFSVMGGTGAGKSALIELIASQYAENGGVIVDLYGSRDNEGLAWLRSPFKDSVLLLKGNSTKVDCNVADVKNVLDLKIRDLQKYKVAVSCSAFYSKVEEEWYSLIKLMNKLWHRTHWSDPWCLLLREASNLLYSRLSLGETQQLAKSYLIYVIREMRHCGFAVALDTLRWYSIDIDFRSISDYTFIKNVGIDGLPHSLRFLYKYFEPYGVMRIPVNGFAVVSRKGPIGFGTSICPAWHKEEREDLLREFDIRIDYGELPFTAELHHGRVSDYEHVRIIKARLESPEGERGMEKLSKTLSRSSKTIHSHIHTHNNMVYAVGECDKCSRVGCQYAKTALE